jgi:putative photosynthetic complex assembly protein 2
MLSIAAPALYALFIWWLGTGIILYLDRLPEHTFRWSLIGAGAVLVGATYGLVDASTDTSLRNAYVAFTCGVLVWGALEMSYFMGLISGPRKAPCPPGCGGWRRFGLAIGTSLYHELSVVATGVVLALLTRDAPNQVGFWTFTVLWLMRWSAKLNVFLGVPNLHGDWLPDHLSFLRSYMGQRSMNYLFPVSVTAATVIIVLMVEDASGLGHDPFGLTALVLVASLLALAVLEHWFLVLPLPDEALWSWALKPTTRDEPAGDSGDDDLAPDRGTPTALAAARSR